ncbi:MAG: DNA primase [Candidatus Kapaibacterium sp.]|nr:MAG: DNA primase [Candidatus Kapabacteria bacterium]
MPIPSDIISEIRDRADIVSVIGQYVHLRQRGKNFVGLCPFHTEKTPSFNVSPELGIYKCFGCGKSGDVFTFLQEYNGLSFLEAVRTVASSVGIAIPEGAEQAPSPADEHRRQLIRALEAARDYYRSQLEKHVAAQRFIHDRGLSQAMVERFQLGAAPPSWTALGDALSAQGFAIDVLRDAGLVAIRDDGSQYDRFRNRVMFPIWNTAGNVIGFGARTLSNDPNEPKYINSPQTAVYDKSATFYGLHLARHKIVHEQHAVIVEGYMDVIALHAAGIEHCVATSGTALTEQHIEILRRLTKRVVLVFDGDTAGWNAAHRAVGLALRSGMSVDVVILPEGEDPDSLVRTRGVEIARQQLSKRLSPIEFLVAWSKRTNDWSRPDIATQQIRALAEMLAPVPDSIYRVLLLRELSDRVGIPVDLLQRTTPAHRVHQPQRNQRVPSPKHSEPPTTPPPPAPILPEEVELLKAVLLSRNAAQTLFDEYVFDPATLPTASARQLLEAVAEQLQTDSSQRPPGSALPDLNIPDHVRTLAEWLIFTHEFPSPRWSDHGIELDRDRHLRRLLDDALGKLEERRLKHRIEELTKQLQQQPDNVELLQQIKRLNELRIQLTNQTP